MLGSITVILLCQLVGEIITKMLKLPVPGPVIGMIILFCGLTFFPKKLPEDIEKIGSDLLRYLALLFVPAGVGVITNMELVIKSWAPLTGVVIVGTFVTIAVTALTMRLMDGRSAAERGHE